MGLPFSSCSGGRSSCSSTGALCVRREAVLVDGEGIHRLAALALDADGIQQVPNTAGDIKEW